MAFYEGNYDKQYQEWINTSDNNEEHYCNYHDSHEVNTSSDDTCSDEEEFGDWNIPHNYPDWVFVNR